MAEAPIANLTVLAIVRAEEDRTSLAKILSDSDWRLRVTGNFREAQTALREFVPGVIISDCRLPEDHCWKDVLHEIGTTEDPPPLIVVDRLADERLWAEVLNLGAYDLLAKPFDTSEVLHAVSTACRRREHQQAMSARRKPAGPAEFSRQTQLSAAVYRS